VSRSRVPAPTVDLPDRMNAAVDFVDANVEAGWGDRLAIIDASDGSTFTYNDVLEGVNRTGNALRSLGVRRDERVMMIMLDSPEFVFTFFGAIKIGAVPIPTNTMLKPADYQYMIDDSRARVLVISEALLPLVEPIRARLNSLDEIIVVGRPAGDGLSYRELTGSASPDLSPADLGKDDACFWLYSSGTTGFPKGAVHLQHDMKVASDLYALPTLGITGTDRTFSVAKLFFAYGLGNGLYFPFRVGAATVLYPGRPEPTRVFEIIDAHRPTLFFSVPTSYAGLLAIDDAAGRFDTSSVRLCVSAGEALPPALYERWKERFGVEILDGIGSTEILHIFISNRPGRVKPGSTGEIRPERSATSSSRATPSAPFTGASTSRPRTRSRATGSGPVTSTRGTRTVISGTRAARTTCLKWEASGSRPSRWSTPWISTPWFSSAPWWAPRGRTG